VHEIEVGTRVAYATRPMGAYAAERHVPVSRLVPIPDGLEESVAAAVLLKGLTAEYLLRRMVALQPGNWVLVHSAAGGVGSLLVQWGKHLGLKVIGTVSSAPKAESARADGADEIVLPGEDLARAREEDHRRRGLLGGLRRRRQRHVPALDRVSPCAACWPATASPRA
jgi:NADPH2:quinone reductase